MDQVAPKALVDLYTLLSAESKTTFLRLLGQQMTAEQHFLVYREMPTLERQKLTSAVFNQFAKDVVPEMLLEAAKAGPKLPPGKIDELQEIVAQRMTTQRESLRIFVQAQVKEARDPKKRKVERDTEIIRLAKKGKTSGEIHLDIKDRWPCSVGAVNQVIQRAKRAGQLPK